MFLFLSGILHNNLNVLLYGGGGGGGILEGKMIFSITVKVIILTGT